MRYVSLFSGVEAASVAWSNLGWEPLAFAEVDEFPSAVLAARFPDVPNLGDVCNVDWEEFHERHGAVDVLIGGSPCQSFSIAGGREGLEGESRLMYEYIRAVRDLVRASGGESPRYILWENVPGCLSSNKGRDFGCLLDELEECGYFLAWRTLDSQFARVFDRSSGRFKGPVPQRRRRVFLVGSLGGPSAADILFERQSMLGDNPTSREAREALAERLNEGSEGGDSAGFGTMTQDGESVSRPLVARMDGSPSVEGRGPSIVAQQSAGFKWHQGAQAGSIGFELEQTPTLTADYHQPAIMFKGGATPKYSEDVSMTLRKSSDYHDHVLTPWDVQSKRVYAPEGTSPSLQSGTGEGMNIQPIVLQSDGTTSLNGHGSGWSEEDVAYTLNSVDHCSVCVPSETEGRAIAFAQNTRDEVRLFGGDGQTVGALAAQPGMKQTCYVAQAQCGETETDYNKPVCIQDGQANGTVSKARERPMSVYLSNGQDVVGSLCAQDGKMVGNQLVKSGKVIVQIEQTEEKQ